MTLTLEQQLLKAPQVAARAHQHQKRKDGTPYVAHPVRVALRAAERFTFGSKMSRYAMIGGFLHDTVEDTDLTFDDLREMGFDETVIAIVDRLTRRTGETYMEFIVRCKGDGLSVVSLVAIEDKDSDIDDNLEDQSALDPDEAVFLTDRYTKAKKVLRAKND